MRYEELIDKEDGLEARIYDSYVSGGCVIFTPEITTNNSLRISTDSWFLKQEIIEIAMLLLKYANQMAE